VESEAVKNSEVTIMRQLSDAILSIYKASKSSTQTQFLMYAFHTISEYVPFNRLRWRAGVTGDTGLVIYTLGSLVTPNAPAGQLITIGCDSRQSTGDNKPVLLPRIVGTLEEETRDRYEFEHRANTLAVWYRFAEHEEPRLGEPNLRFATLSFLVLSLHRDGAMRSFTDNERDIVQTLHTHISEAWATNAADGLQRFQYDQHERDRAGAIVTADGILLFGDERFFRHLAERWPRPIDARLPEPLRLALAAEKTRHIENTHGYRIMREGTIAYIYAHPRRAVDTLTARELQVAQKVASGLTHKEIARLFGVSPSTVRKQIVSIHERMGVRNNAELAAQLGPGP
jgi:DNA-binding CsgD family transcriptional regulator